VYAPVFGLFERLVRPWAVTDPTIAAVKRLSVKRLRPVAVPRPCIMSSSSPTLQQFITKAALGGLFHLARIRP
jgi:hypothetical protein